MTVVWRVLPLLFVSLILSGCFLAAAAGVGAEAGYVASQTDRTAGETLKDQYITSAVKTQLLADQTTPGMDINVDTFKRKVTLRGALRSQDQVDKAIEIARNTSDVAEVESKLVVVD